MDKLTFDGSCNPNPGGVLGYGWTLLWADGRSQDGRGERPPDVSSTVNIAEYLGLINGLRAYIAAGGQGPLQVVGDSQLIIGQVTGAMKSKQPNLIRLRDEAQALIRRIPGGATLRWQRREENSAADLLARGPKESDLPTPAARTYVADVQTASISDDLRAAIARLNAHVSPGFSDVSRLRVGGTDALSSLRLAQLIEQAGPVAVTAIAQAFPDHLQQQAAVLRWALRGLAVEIAIRKGQVDRELAARAGNDGRRR
jgi:ribonuclease HI